ncbi:putative membrane-bound metal-dependent hydrolase [Granulibacter bethesdensis]|nr:putative membrane-bound metal-dependent hydrolase [Granulibacter bethesdensis]
MIVSVCRHGRFAMMAGSHVALGAAAWLIVAPKLGLPPADATGLALAVVGALLPDVDHPKSWVGQRLGGLSIALSKAFGHRGVTHSLLAIIACGWAMQHSRLSRTIIDPLVTGYLSHLAADLLTPAGLRLGWPLKGTWALPLCRTGSAFEPLIVALALWGAGSATGVSPASSLVGLRQTACIVLPKDFFPFCASGHAHGSRAVTADRVHHGSAGRQSI